QQPVLAETSSYNNIEPGSYDITAKALNADKEEASGAAGFIDENATLTVTEDSFLFTINIPNNPMAEISGLQVEGAEPVEKSGTKWTYQLNEIKEILNAQTQYEVPMFNMKHDVPFRFKLEGLTTLPTVEETPEQPEKPEQPEDTPEQPDEEPDQPEETPSKPEEKPEAEGKVQTIDYVIKHETEDKASAADEFFKKPGKIVEKNGKYFLEVTVKNWSMIGDLKANGKKINVLKENKKDDEAVVQIPIAKDFSKIVPLSMKVTLPGLYETTHEARLVMDIDSLKEVEEESGSNGNSGKDPN